jgi:uncharacterized membrane-anchored protein
MFLFEVRENCRKNAEYSYYEYWQSDASKINKFWKFFLEFLCVFFTYIVIYIYEQFIEQVLNLAL